MYIHQGMREWNMERTFQMWFKIRNSLFRYETNWNRTSYTSSNKYQCFQVEIQRHVLKHIVTCRGYAWRIITGSGLDDWIYWHFCYNYSSLQSLITAHNQWLSKTRSFPSWTASVFSSTVTDLVLVHESVTSSASVVRCLTLHSGTFNHDCDLTDLRMKWLTTSV
jgi:hypothetical protein